MVEPDRNNYPNLQQQVKKYLKQSSTEPDVYAQHIHRLDRPVSGVILFAKQKAVLKNLSEQFAARSVKKFYQALTQQAPVGRSGTFENWFRKEKKKAVIYESEMEYAEKVKLDYQVSEFADDRFLWNIELHTGKYHQIRAQLSHAGCPVVGDHIYGSSLAWKPDSIALHACRLEFHHPVSGELLVMESMNDFNERRH